MQNERLYDILKVLRQEKNHSKASLARALGVSPSTVNGLTNELIQKGLIVPTGRKQGLPQGRKGEVIDLNPMFRTAIGIEITDLDVTGTLIDFAGAVHEKTTESLVSQEHDAIVDTVLRTVKRLQSAALLVAPLEGVGIAAHGHLNPDTGELLRFPGNPRWEPLRIAAIVQECCHTSCRVTFRLRAATYGELLYGGWSAIAGPIVYLNSGPGNGFGLGIVENGRVLTGATGAAGQFGHFGIRPGGKRCFCGSHGCLVTVASISAVLQRVTDALERGVESSLQGVWAQGTSDLNFRQVSEHAARGDKLAMSVIKDLGADLGLAMSYVLNLLNPSHVVIGGVMAQGGPHLLESIRAAAQQHCTAPVFSAASWCLSELTENAAALGAAAMMLDHYFGPRQRSASIA